MDCADVALGWGQGVGRQAREDMDEGMAAVLQPHARLQLGKEGFDAASFSRQQLAQQGEEEVLYGAANAGEQVQTPLPSAFHGGLAVGSLSPNPLPRRAAAMRSSGWRSSVLSPVILKATV